MSDLYSLNFPLPPLAEQQRIVTEVERRVSIIDALESTAKSHLKRADRLRQAILKRAFEGKLVPQDPNDEPASVLLERIRTERAEARRIQSSISDGRSRLVRAPGTRVGVKTVVPGAKTLYQQLIDDLKEHLGSNDLADLKETDSRHDLSYLHSATGIPMCDVEALCGASRLGSAAKALDPHSSLTAEVFFALLRGGLSCDPKVLLATNRLRLQQTIQCGVEHGVVSSALDTKQSLQRIINDFERYRANLADNTPHGGGQKELKRGEPS